MTLFMMENIKMKKLAKRISLNQLNQKVQEHFWVGMRKMKMVDL